MKQIDLETFKASCQKKRCLRNTMITPQCPKDYKQEQCYTKFTQKKEKDKVKQEIKYKEQKEKSKEIEVDEKWVEVREKVRQRDGNKCRLLSILTSEEKIFLLKEQRENLWLNKTLDPAHVLSRSKRPDLIYSEDNIVILGRLFHSRLDSIQNPLTGENISSIERDGWWIRIVDEDLYNKLLKNTNKNS